MSELDTVCKGCGLHYSLHMATVCPECFLWPTPEFVATHTSTVDGSVAPQDDAALEQLIDESGLV